MHRAPLYSCHPVLVIKYRPASVGRARPLGWILEPTPRDNAKVRANQRALRVLGTVWPVIRMSGRVGAALPPDCGRVVESFRGLRRAPYVSAASSAGAV